MVSSASNCWYVLEAVGLTLPQKSRTPSRVPNMESLGVAGAVWAGARRDKTRNTLALLRIEIFLTISNLLKATLAKKLLLHFGVWLVCGYKSA